MADSCIVCLEDLDAVPDPAVHDDLQDAGEVAAQATDLDLPQPHPSTTTNNLAVALIKPCGHVLHDECLREWSQQANSCPICRQAFNLVEVLDKVGGMLPLGPKQFPSANAQSANCFSFCERFLRVRSVLLVRGAYLSGLSYFLQLVVSPRRGSVTFSYNYFRC